MSIINMNFNDFGNIDFSNFSQIDIESSDVVVLDITAGGDGYFYTLIYNLIEDSEVSTKNEIQYIIQKYSVTGEFLNHIYNQQSKRYVFRNSCRK